MWLYIKELVIDLVDYVFPAIALGISLLSFFYARKANRIKDRLLVIEEKLKTYELDKIEKERENSHKACIEARIVPLGNHKYKLKIWNSGEATAYNVDYSVSPEFINNIIREKVPFEFLDKGKNFEEHVLVYGGTPNKTVITTSWKDSEGIEFSKEQVIQVY
jgi:hypothetical protein